MSQRLGPADGRAFTIATSSRLLNNFIMEQNGIPLVSNYEYRQLLQSRGPEIAQSIQSMQTLGQRPAASAVNQCMSTDIPLLKVPNTY